MPMPISSTSYDDLLDAESFLKPAYIVAEEPDDGGDALDPQPPGCT